MSARSPQRPYYRRHLMQLVYQAITDEVEASPLMQ
jgi:hypothetical protein